MARPRGIWADKPWRDAIRKAVAKRTEDGGKTLEKLAEKLVTKAYDDGEGWAFHEIGNRLDGKAHQSTDIVVTDERMVVESPPPEENTEDWLRKYGPKH